MKFVITMGQAFRSQLPKAVREMGGEVREQGFADCSTSWVVLAEFPARTKQHDVAQTLWAKFPGTSVTVATPDHKETK